MRSEEVTKWDGELFSLVGDLLDTYLDRPSAAGLAAVQIGELRRVIVCGGTVLINPKIIRHPTERCIVLPGEGCLSVPGRAGGVPRWPWVVATWYDLTGKSVSRRLDGVAAVVIQHELDHLDGVLFTDFLEEESVNSTHEAKPDGATDGV